MKIQILRSPKVQKNISWTFTVIKKYLYLSDEQETINIYSILEYRNVKQLKANEKKKKKKNKNPRNKTSE